MMNREIAEISLTTVGIGGLYLLFHHCVLFRDRTLDEVVGYLRKVNWEEVSRLFDVHEEEELMGFGAVGDRRRSQRARLDLACEFVERMAYNNRILSQWGRTERHDMLKHHLEYEPETVEQINQLISTTAEFRKMAFITTCRIRIFSLLNFDKLRFLPVPSVAALRTVCKADLLQTYQGVIRAAAALATVYGEESVQDILASL